MSFTNPNAFEDLACFLEQRLSYRNGGAIQELNLKCLASRCFAAYILSAAQRTPRILWKISTEFATLPKAGVAAHPVERRFLRATIL